MQQIAITLVSQYGEEAQDHCHASEQQSMPLLLDQEEWIKWEKVVQILENFDEKSPLDGLNFNISIYLNTLMYLI